MNKPIIAAALLTFLLVAGCSQSPPVQQTQSPQGDGAGADSFASPSDVENSYSEFDSAASESEFEEQEFLELDDSTFK